MSEWSKRNRSGRRDPARLCLALLLAANIVHAEGWNTVLLSPSNADVGVLEEWKENGVRAVALAIEDPSSEVVPKAIENVRRAGLEVHYWFEIGRSPATADSHPEWMASIQGHQEWRRLFPTFPAEKENNVVKAYPWVPVAYEEGFDAHHRRVSAALSKLPKGECVWLNNVQGPPSVCGCGHPLCRWTTDYGKKSTATLLGADAAARFVEAIRADANGAEVIPVWATECEQHDKDTVCGGVGCYAGRCWKDWTQQLGSLSEAAPTIGVLATYKELGRDLTVYGEDAGWVSKAIEQFQAMPPRRGGEGVKSDRLVAVIQGWDVSDGELQAQIEHAVRARARGVLIAREPLVQSWEPRLVPLD